MKKQLLYLTAVLFIAASSCKKNEDINNRLSTLTLFNDHLITLKSGVVVQKRGDKYIWEGDMVLSKAQLKALDEYGTLITKEPEYIGPDTLVHPVYNIPKQGGADEKAVPRSFSIYPTPYNLWAMVRIIYGSNLTIQEKQKVHSALLEMQANSNVRFFNATCEPLVDPVYGFQYPNIEFWSTGDADVSESALGRQGGVQRINLADFAFESFDNSVIIHEICHALGMRHEQTRIDRDTYVSINTSNLKPLGQANFAKPPTNYYQTGTYDLHSVMGYSSFTISTSVVYNIDLPMYTQKDGSYIYQGGFLSSSDRAWINSFYVPYIARSDVYAELTNIVYKPDNTIMTSAERLNLQAALNNGNPTPPNCCRLTNDLGKYTCP